MRIFATKSFSRFCRKEGIEEAQLLAALAMVTNRSTSLGGEVFKLRVARKGSGKSGGYRTIVAIRFEHRALFLFGFAKSEKDSLNELELAAAKSLAREGLAASEAQIDRTLAQGRWIEMKDEKEK